ncbi:MAG: energy transducer TonB [Syntrophales bacterium]|nr:energy transducer TonB [Syntrophales bacterium]
MNGYGLEAESLKRVFLNSVIISAVFHCALVAMVLTGPVLSASPNPLLNENSCLFVDLVTQKKEGSTINSHAFKKPFRHDSIEVVSPVQLSFSKSNNDEKTSGVKPDSPPVPEGFNNKDRKEGKSIVAPNPASDAVKSSSLTTGEFSYGSLAEEQYHSKAVPRYGHNPPPQYPPLARIRGQEGLVLLSVEVLPDGRVGQVVVKQTSGYNLLDHSAIEAVKRWSFIPGKRMGVPITMWVDVPIRFALK